MKNLITTVLILLLCGVTQAQKKEFEEVIKKELSFQTNSSDNMLNIHNIFGSITVEGYDGSTVKLEVIKQISAANEEDLTQGKKEIGLKILKEGRNLIVYPDAPFVSYKDGRLKYNWCNDEDSPAYDHKLEFKVKMPRNSGLKVSTVNDGEIEVKNTRGNYVKANNINGGIALKNITGKTEVHAINGEVSISYASNPKETSSYYSLNGDINITYQKNLSAAISFTSMNGELYTDFKVAKQYAKTSKNSSGKGQQVKYKYESKPIVEIGNGGVDFDFETLNGDVIIKKI